MPLFPNAPLRIQPYFGFRNEHRVVISARALRSRVPKFEKRGFFRDVATMLRQYASHEEAFVPVALLLEEADGSKRRYETSTDDEGFVHFNIEFDAVKRLPSDTTWERAAFEWIGESGKPETVAAHILAPGTSAQTGVISDIDDTIIETGITGNVRAMLKNWKRVLRQMPGERLMVPGARQFYAAIGGNPGSPEDSANIRGSTPLARIRPVFYVSSSPWNLFSYLVKFKREQDLPLGPIMLRDWGFNRKTLGSKSHGSHKVKAIEGILEEVPSLRFILAGDDTQKDPFAFAEIVAKDPDRIAGVFIRSVKGEPPSVEASAAHAKIEGAGVPFWTGSDYEEAATFARDHGLDYASKAQLKAA